MIQLCLKDLKMKDKTMEILEAQLLEYNNQLRDLDNYYKSLEVNIKTIDIYNGYIRDRLSVISKIDALTRFRISYCEEMI